MWWLKDNQPTVRAKSEQLLSLLIAGTPHYETTQVTGNRVETHQIWCMAVTGEEVGFTAAKQIFAVRRIAIEKSNVGKNSDEISYGITSIPFAGTHQKNAETILTIRRKHWSIESKSHNSRDKTYQEDTCQVRNHQAARNLVAFRQLAIFLSLNDAHAPSNNRDRCVPEFNRFSKFNRDTVLEWFMNPKGFRD